MVNFLQNGNCLFIFATLFLYTANAIISTKKPFLYFSQFSPPIPSLLVHKILITIPTNIPFRCNSAIFHLRFFLRTIILAFYSKNIFPTLTISPIQVASRDQGARSIVRTDTFLISFFFLKVWKVITAFTITDSLSLRLRTLMYSRCDKPSYPPFLISSTYCYYFQTLCATNTTTRTYIPPEKQLLKLIFIKFLAFLYTNHAPIHPHVQEQSPPSIEYRAPSKQEAIHSPYIVESGYGDNPKDPQKKTKTSE